MCVSNRLVHINNKVEIKNLDHNHPVVVGRRSVGEALKLKAAWKKGRQKRSKAKQKEEKVEKDVESDQSSD